MEREIDMGVYILAAGKQKRYESSESKLLADVNGRPAFTHLMDTLLTVCPEENITMFSADSSNDFNNWATDIYPKTNLIIDEAAGQGTAGTLKKSFPWERTVNFITEADIYYESDLIRGLLRAWATNSEIKASIGITPRIHVAPTHRQINLDPSLTVSPQNEASSAAVKYRNIGAYILEREVEDYIKEGIKNLIDVIGLMILCGEVVVPYIYSESLLHIAELRDVKKWREYFSNSSINL